MDRPPTATITLADGSSRQLVFDLAMLEQIELATGRSVNQLLFDELASWFNSGAQPPAEPLTPEETAAIDRERAARLVRNVRASFVRTFLAAVLGLRDATAVGEAVGLRGAMAAFTAAVAGFAAAVIAFNGGERDEGGAEPLPSESATCGPGPGSSSGSQDPSSSV